MAAGDALLVKADRVLADIVAGWSPSTTIIATLLFLFLAYPWLTWKDPDTHPFLLARQATASPIRQPGESAVYRSLDIPYGYPLRSGLNIKDPGTPKWSSGRNGDLRDIWLQAARGPVKDDGSFVGGKGKLLTVLGRERVIERSLESVTAEVNVVGQYLQESKCRHVAICLPNSVELLASIFATAFFGLHPTLIPYGLSTEDLGRHLKTIQPDVLVAEAGTLEVRPLLRECQSLSQLIWVTKAGNRHMDFAPSPNDVGEKMKIHSWHDLIEKHKSSEKSELPPTEKSSPNPSLSIAETSGVVEYTSENIVAAVAALINTLPRNQRITTDDVVFPIAPLTSSYPLILTLAALFSNATIALNSVAGEEVDLRVAASTITPTIIIASAKSTLSHHGQLLKTQRGPLAKLSSYWQNQSLLNGNMPKTPSFGPPGKTDFTSKLRLVFVYRNVEDRDSSRLSSAALAELKILLGARTCYALTAPGVAGAVSQTHVYDYRQAPAKENHFGPPLSSVDVVLVGEDEKLGSNEPEGKIVVRGPAVRGGEVMLDVVGRIRSDHTISLYLD